ncbi:hypothetical protein [Sphingobacterium ginsenosidimutans]|uniref:hypothetical protein n=1 Tax=Sphingobacterium ginsenosidimutans TaxID=687845 RepID=UPI0031F8E544
MKKISNYLNITNWIVITLFNLLIVSIFGLIMRLKFLFPIPWLEQRNLMHAHSHFAFSAWVSQALMIFLIMAVLGIKANQILCRKYQYILWTNWLIAIGMLFSFSIAGYNLSSIILSFLSTLVSYWFCFQLSKDLKSSKLPPAISILIKAALFFNIFSSLGTYFLAYLKASHQLDPLQQLTSVYFYLHFQYNGWFFFGCIALLACWLYRHTGKTPMSPRFSLVCALTVIPTFFLSILWWKNLPLWLYIITVITVILHFVLWGTLARRIVLLIRSNLSLRLIQDTSKIWLCVLFAIFLKLILQALSVIPALSQKAYGFRPIVIAYLHLVLLAVITLFLFGYAFQVHILKIEKGNHYGVYGLLFGIFVNEFVLMLQGLGGFTHHSIAGTHTVLTIAAAIIVASLYKIIQTQLR